MLKNMPNTKERPIGTEQQENTQRMLLYLLLKN